MGIPRLLGAGLLALLPSVLKVPLYRWLFGFQIGRGVRIGLSVFSEVKSCTIGDGAVIGHLNAFIGVGTLRIGERSRVGSLNLFRGGDRITLAAYTTVLRGNVINSIREPDAVNPTEPIFHTGRGVVITTGHWFDFTDRIELGPSVIVGGRGSSFWTHNRQRTRPISIGANAYLGSDVRFAPGSVVAEDCIVALGSVVMGRFEDPAMLIMGNPAAAQRPLRERDLALVRRRTRADLPDLSAEPVGSAPSDQGVTEDS